MENAHPSDRQRRCDDRTRTTCGVRALHGRAFRVVEKPRSPFSRASRKTGHDRDRQRDRMPGHNHLQIRRISGPAGSKRDTGEPRSGTAAGQQRDKREEGGKKGERRTGRRYLRIFARDPCERSFPCRDPIQRSRGPGGLAAGAKAIPQPFQATSRPSQGVRRRGRLGGRVAQGFRQRLLPGAHCEAVDRL